MPCHMGTPFCDRGSRSTLTLSISSVCLRFLSDRIGKMPSQIPRFSRKKRPPKREQGASQRLVGSDERT